MATKTFEELKQMAIQIRDEKTNKQNTATRIGTQMLEHLNKLEQEYYDKTTLDKRTTELNISVLYPTLGVNGTNKYTLAGAIAQVPAEYRSIKGLKVVFINENNETETWEYKGGGWTVSNFTEVGARKISEQGLSIIRSVSVNMNTNIAFSQFCFFKFGYFNISGLFVEGSEGWGTEWNTVFIPVKSGVTYKIKSERVGNNTKFWSCNRDLKGINSKDYSSNEEFSYTAQDEDVYICVLYSRNMYVIPDKNYSLIPKDLLIEENRKNIEENRKNIEENRKNIEGAILGKETEYTNTKLIESFIKDVVYKSTNNNLGEVIGSNSSVGYYSIVIDNIESIEEVRIKAVGGFNYRKWIFTDNDNKIVAIASSEGASGADVEERKLDIPVNAKRLIVQISDYNLTSNGLSLDDVKVSLKTHCNGIAYLSKHLADFSVDSLNILNFFDKKFNMLNTSCSMASIIHSWGFIGGSTSSGEFEYTEDGATKFIDEYDYSIGQRFCKLNSVEGYNFSQGGQYAKGWCEGSGDRAWGGAQKTENLKHAYIIDLGSNDMKYYEVGNLETDVDWDDYNNNADTFAGWIVGLVQRLRSVNPRCYIFFYTSRNYMYPNSSDYATKALPIIRQLPDFLQGHFEYDRFYLADNALCGAQYDNIYRSVLMNGGHPSVIGYQYEAFVMNTLIDYIIRTNYNDFKEAMFVISGKHRE